MSEPPNPPAFLEDKYNILPSEDKQGCPNCCRNVKITNDKFIERSKKIHGDKYDYSNLEYIHITKPVKIICKRCYKFTIEVIK